MNQEIRYIDDDKILVREIRGKADFSEIYNSWLDLIENNIFKPSLLGMINDFRGAELNVKVSDINRILQMLRENQHILGSIKIAVVADSSKTIVFPMIVEKTTKEFKVRAFSTFEAARDWVLGIIE